LTLCAIERLPSPPFLAPASVCPPPRSPPPRPRSFGRFLQLATGEFPPPQLPRKVEGEGIDGVGRSPDQGSRGASLAVDVRGSATPYNPPTRCSLPAAAHRVGSGGAQAVQRPSVLALSSDELSGRPIDPLRPSLKSQLFPRKRRADRCGMEELFQRQACLHALKQTG